MKVEVAPSFNKSAIDFRARVQPVINEVLELTGRWIDVGLIQQDVCSQLDRVAGIDALHISADGAIATSFAYRCQYIKAGWHPFRTFTSRTVLTTGRHTERHKRLSAIASGGMYPHWTLQAYMTEGDQDRRLLSVGLIRTQDLYDWVERNYQGGLLTAGAGGNQFEVYPFDAVARTHQLYEWTDLLGWQVHQPRRVA